MWFGLMNIAVPLQIGQIGLSTNSKLLASEAKNTHGSMAQWKINLSQAGLP